MFAERDLIVREIRRIAELIGRALQLDALAGYEEAEEALGVLHRGIFGLDRDLTLRLSPDSLALMLPPGERAAAITLLESEIAYAEGRKQDEVAYLRRAQLAAINTR
jgi:hypothetical protein